MNKPYQTFQHRNTENALQMILIHFAYFNFLFSLAEGFKTLHFSANRRLHTGALIQNEVLSQAPKDLTICIDFNIKLVKNSRLLVTNGTNDLEIQIPKTLDRIYTKFKGIWYLTSPNRNIEPYHFGTFCMSYSDEENKIIFAFNGFIIFEKNDHLLRENYLNKQFINRLVLGDKTSLLRFSGDITRFNIWSKSLPQHILEKMTSCDGLPSDGGFPDLVDWETAQWNISDGIFAKEKSSYPCSFHQRDPIDVLMPYAAENLHDAIDTCSDLGGKMKAPKSEEEMKKIMRKTREKMNNSDCSSYLWLPYKQNLEKRWVHFDGTEESLHPEFYHKPDWLVWEKGQPNGGDLEKCASVFLNDKSSPFAYDSDCVESDYCYICDFEDITFFNFRGLCRNLHSVLDLEYLVNMEEVEDNLQQGVVWTGYRKSRIMFDRNLTRWKITSLDNEAPILILSQEVKAM